MPELAGKASHPTATDLDATGSRGKFQIPFLDIEIKNRRQPDAETNNDRPLRDISGMYETSTLEFAVRFQSLI
jgi:hypothetical protein